MKILFTRFPLESSPQGGAEIQTMSLMTGLRERGHAVAFLGSCPALLAACKRENIPAVECSIGPPPVTKAGAISFLWRHKRMQRQLEKMLERFNRLDVLCMLSMSEKILLTPFAAEQGIKVLWIEHDRIGRWLEKNPWKPQLLRASKNATTVAVSRLTREHYVDLGWDPKHVVDIVNGVDEGRLQAEQLTEKRLSSSVLYLGCVARLSKDKGVDLLIEAVAGLPDIVLTIVGQGKEERSLRRMIDHLERREGRSRIKILSAVPSVGAFYRSIDALVLPSRLEDPCPLAPMEALTVGTPVILTDACGTAGYLKDGEEALIVPAGNIEALKNAIVSLRDSTLRESLVKKGREAAHRNFSFDCMLDEYVALMQAS